MGNPNAGYLNLLDISPDGTTWTALGGMNNGSFSPKANMLDKTYFNQGDAAVHKFQGLKDGQSALSGDWIYADAGQVQLLARFADGAACYFRFRFDGTHGFSVAGIVSGYQVKASTTGKAEFSGTLEFNSIPTAI
jgi:hypothetical protein